MTQTPPEPSPTENWNRVAVRGKYEDLLGAPLVGSVTFTMTPGRAIDHAAKTTVVGRAITAPLDETGAFEVFLPATDDPDINPSGFTYQVKENFDIGAATYAIAVPLAAAETGIDLSDVGPTDPTNGFARVGVPRGGTTGQVLYKLSNADFDTGWGDAPTGGGGGGAVSSVNGDVGDVVITADDLGLGLVNNTPDMDKPISLATQEALNEKQPAGSYAAAAHAHGVADISDATAVGQALMTAVDDAAARTAIGAGTSNLALGTAAGTAKAGDWVPAVTDVTGLVDELGTKVEQPQVDTTVNNAVAAAVATRMPIASGAPVGRFLGFLTANPDLGTLVEGDWWFIIEAAA